MASNVNEPLPITEELNKTKITDLNFDLFEKYMSHLKLRDLLNIANTSIQFRGFARSKFQQKYSAKPVYFNFDQNAVDSVKADDVQINVSGLKNQFQFLRCFGDSILELNISLTESNSPRLETYQNGVIAYLNEFCTTKKLRVISFTGSKVIAYDLLKGLKPFSGIESVSIESCYIGESTNFIELFPTVRDLKLHRNYTTNQMCIQHYFPNLKTLDIAVKMKSDDNFSAEAVGITLNLNPQLQVLKTENFWSMNIFNQIEQLTKLESLDIRWHHKLPENYASVNIHSKSVQKFHLEVYDIMTTFPMLFDGLKEFSFVSFVKESIFQFFEKHQSIKTVRIGVPPDRMGERIEDSFYTELVYWLRGAECVDLYGMRGIFRHQVSILLDGYNEVGMGYDSDVIQNHLGDGWKMTRPGNKLAITLERLKKSDEGVSDI